MTKWSRRRSASARLVGQVPSGLLPSTCRAGRRARPGRGRRACSDRVGPGDGAGLRWRFAVLLVVVPRPSGHGSVRRPSGSRVAAAGRGRSPPASAAMRAGRPTWRTRLMAEELVARARPCSPGARRGAGRPSCSARGRRAPRRTVVAAMVVESSGQGGCTAEVDVEPSARSSSAMRRIDAITRWARSAVPALRCQPGGALDQEDAVGGGVGGGELADGSVQLVAEDPDGAHPTSVASGVRRRDVVRGGDHRHGPVEPQQRQPSPQPLGGADDHQVAAGLPAPARPHRAGCRARCRRAPRHRRVPRRPACRARHRPAGRERCGTAAAWRGRARPTPRAPGCRRRSR